MDGWLVLHFLLSPCSKLSCRICRICLFDMFLSTNMRQPLWGAHMVNEVGSPVSVISQSSKESRHTAMSSGEE